jgi:hypothetical protein
MERQQRQKPPRTWRERHRVVADVKVEPAKQGEVRSQLAPCDGDRRRARSGLLEDYGHCRALGRTCH